MNDSGSYEAACEWGLGKSFTPFHGQLLDLCLNPPPNYSIPSLEKNGVILTTNDLIALRIMTEVEFMASYHQALLGTETGDAEPRIFDVYLMQTILNQTTVRGSKRPIAICVPVKEDLCWWNGRSKADGGELWPLEPKSHIRKLASLSGSARVLQTLSDTMSNPSELAKWAMNRQEIFSVDVVDSDSNGDIPSSHNLNNSQQLAVDAMDKFMKGFFCIQGPPGCGKTTTMVQMILAAKRRSCVLVTAPSNAAVANIALKLYETGKVSFPDLVVDGPGCHESVQFLEPSIRSRRYMTFLEKRASALETVDGTNQTENQLQHAQRLLEDFALWLHLDKEDWTLSKISENCPTIPMNEKGSITYGGRRVLNRIIGNASIVLCTLNHIGAYGFQNALAVSGCDTLMLDEGGQCTQAEFFLATNFPGITRIVIMGDPKQLNPTVIDQDCAQAGYGQSFLGQVYKLSPDKLHLLDTQYRMDPSILAFPNSRFYNNRIKNGENVWDRSPHVETPYLFIDTDGRGHEEKHQFSWQNQYEASVIATSLHNDKDIRCILGSDENVKVIIIAPYKAQVKLIEDQIKLPKGNKAQLMVSTVDAFQGQEGDIVILSTVRTKGIGFVDNAQRLNVALTRAKRILRVVGDRRFFESLRTSSTLRALVCEAMRFGNLQLSPVKRLRHCAPDWSTPTLWRITLTQRFHHCIRKMNASHKNICLNTLFALATPDLKAIRGGKVTAKPGWHMNSLTGTDDLYVVWIPTKDTAEEKPTLEAHFAGTRTKCLNFLQTFHRFQSGSLTPKSNMTGYLKTETDEPISANGNLTPRWKLDDGMVQAILSDSMPEMPLSFLELDPSQKLVARAEPPLLIESRSGTGKTLVLLQHVALTTRTDQNRPACFVTVSPRLTEELKKKYNELKPILFNGLLPTEFYSFKDILGTLLRWFRIDDFTNKDTCTFEGFLSARKAHKPLALEAHVIRNEIGGVITGSLEAAIKKVPLNRQEYLESKRSNISNKSTEGLQKRNLVYDEYEKYTKWKIANTTYDVGDVVLRLLQQDLDQIFSSAYLDEIQDLPYAAIYLLCHLAGKDSLHWVCAGDPAQMISPGCSFTFDGLKQTLLAVAPGINSKLKDVHHLLVNYRTTKDILVMANAILETIKREFPGAISHFLPEIAVKDLGLSIVLCNWTDAMQTKVKFGENQVFIYGPSDSTSLPEEASKWLNDHPFILSSLDSKGLEFDDVVVAFDMDRKIWDVSRKLEASLGMLRELYVAVTRAQRRVVILVQPNNKNMQSFFQSFKCEIVEAENILKEFDIETSKEQWFQRGMSLYQEGHLKLAVGCFTRAEEHGWASLSKGKQCLTMGLKEAAESYFFVASRFFHDNQDTRKVVEILMLLVDMHSKRDPMEDEIFQSALLRSPDLLPRNYSVSLCIRRGDWHLIFPKDLADPACSSIFLQSRSNTKLKEIVRNANEEERIAIQPVLPWAQADFDYDSGNYVEALKIYLQQNDFDRAVDSSERLLKRDTRRVWTYCDDLVRLWTQNRSAKSNLKQISNNTRLGLLNLLFTEPLKAASTAGPKCIEIFGRDVVRTAFEKAQLDPTNLLLFKDKMFQAEVAGIFERRHAPYYTDVVLGLVDAGYTDYALVYARQRHWENDDLLRLVLIFLVPHTWLLQALDRNSLLDATEVMLVMSNKVTETSKNHYISCLRTMKQSRTRMPYEIEKADFSQLWDEEMYLELFFIYSHQGQWYNAVQASQAALENHALASRNVSKILRIWDERVKINSSISFRSQKILFHLWEMKQALQDYRYIRLMTYRSGKQSAAMPLLGSSIEELRRTFQSDSEVDFGILVKEYGATVATYTQLVRGERHDESLLLSIANHFAALKSRLSARLEELIPVEQRQGMKKSKTTKDNAKASTKDKTPVTQKKQVATHQDNVKKAGKNKKKAKRKGRR